MGSKKTSTTNQKTSQTNTLPSWLLNPYQQAVTQAGSVFGGPAIGQNTQTALNGIRDVANSGTQQLQGASGILSNFASGNFGSNALTGAANGDFLASNPFAQNGQPTAVSGALDPYRNGGMPANVSGALSGFAGNGGGSDLTAGLAGFLKDGGLDTSYIDRLFGGYTGKADTGYIGESLLNQTAQGQFLTPDSNPYIKGIADKSADAAQARINAQFGSAGRSNGSGLYAQLFGEGIADASNSVYAQNYANERQMQQGAQNTLLGANQTASENAASRFLSGLTTQLGAQQAAREAALARQFGAASTENQNAQSALARQLQAAGSIFGAENAANENAAGRQYGALATIFGADNASAENAANRQASAYEAERARQQAAAGGLLNTQMQSATSLPGLLSSMLGLQQNAFTAGQYEDTADQQQFMRYLSALAGLSAPFGQSSGTMSGTTTERTGGLGSTIGTLAQMGGALGSMFANPFAAAAAPITSTAQAANLATQALPFMRY